MDSEMTKKKGKLKVLTHLRRLPFCCLRIVWHCAIAVRFVFRVSSEMIGCHLVVSLHHFDAYAIALKSSTKKKEKRRQIRITFTCFVDLIKSLCITFDASEINDLLTWNFRRLSIKFLARFCDDALHASYDSAQNRFNCSHIMEETSLK